MVLDTSALLAILLQEPEASGFTHQIEADTTRMVSAANYLESAMVIESRRGREGGRNLDLLLHQMRAEVAAFTVEQAEVARATFRRYGRGHHRAGLNFGDCMAYALSKISGEKLLFKGDDFSHTDVEAVD